MYIGNDEVIEAKGTQYGVVKSKASDKKWTFWGELKGVDYDSKVPVPVGDRPTLRKGDKGAMVSTLQLELKDRGYDLGPCGVDGDFGSATEKAVKAFQKAEGLKVDGIVGPKTWKALDGQITQDTTYSVTIKGLTAQQAAELANRYKNVTVTEG